LSDLKLHKPIPQSYLSSPKSLVMKVILTLLFVIFFGAVNAQDVKVETTAQGIATEITIKETTKEIKTLNENGVARLYRYKNSRVKKALAFTTKRNKSKLA